MTTPEPATKKRVVLGEISNNSKVFENEDLLCREFEVDKCSKKRKRGVKEDVCVDVGEKFDDPQMCCAYVSDIYEYLQQMEVRFFVFVILESLFVRLYLNLFWFGMLIMNGCFDL